MSLKSCTEKTVRDALLVAVSRQIAAAIGAQPFQCAMNAWRALIEFPDLFRPGGRLVEGWFVIETEERVVMNEHVWCEQADGQIVDPSVLLLVPETTPVWYFTGLTRTWEETEALEGELFPHVRFDGLHGEDGLGHPGYQAAREAARRKVYALSFARQPPKGMQFLTAQDLDGVLPPQRTEKPVAPIIEGEPLDISLSLTTAEYLPAVDGMCWANAREALLRMPHAFFSAWYVEGWLISQRRGSLRITEHGWVWNPRTGIVDPTIVLGEEVPSRLAYLPGLQFSWLQMQAYTHCQLPLARSQPSLGGLDYQHACQLALARGEVLAWQTGLPLLSEPGIVVTIRGSGKAVLQVEETAWDFPVPSTPSARVAPLLRERENGKHKP